MCWLFLSCRLTGVTLTRADIFHATKGPRVAVRLYRGEYRGWPWGGARPPAAPPASKSVIGLELDKSVKALLIMYLQLFTSTPLHF